MNISLQQHSTRWFPAHAMARAMESLESELSYIDRQMAVGQDIESKKDNTPTMVYGTVGLIVGALLLVAVLIFVAPRNPDHTFTGRNIGSLALVFVLLPAIAFAWARYSYGPKSKRVQERSEALDCITARESALQHSRSAKINGQSVGCIPWLASELDTVVSCDLHGSYAGHRLSLLQCVHVVDMSLSTLEASCGKLAAKVMSHVQHEHIHRRCLDAIVFTEPIPELPDIFWASKKQPLNWYFKKQFHGRVEPLATDPRWLVSSDPQACLEALTPEVQALVEDYPDAILQVMGGYVCVIPQVWNENRATTMPCQEADIERNLTMACDVYEALQRSMHPESQESSYTDGVAVGETAETGGATAVCTAPAAVGTAACTHASLTAAPAPMNATVPQSTAATALGTLSASGLKLKRNWWLRGLALLCGVGILGVGGIATLGTVVLSARANSAPGWPTTQGRVIESDVEVSGSRTLRFAPHIVYEYAVDGRTYYGDDLMLGPVKWERSRDAVQRVVAQYPVGKTVEVYHDPDNHDAVLDPRLASASMLKVVGGFSGGMVLLGGFLLYLGLRRLRSPKH